MQAGLESRQLSHHAPHRIVLVAAAHELVALEGLLDLFPAGFLFRRLRADEFLELEEVRLGPGGQGLRFAAVVIDDQRRHFLVVHDGDDLFRQPVHVAVGTLETERRLGAKLVRLRRRMDVFQVHLEDDFANGDQLLHHRQHLFDLGRGIAAFKATGVTLAAARQTDEGVNVLVALVGQGREHGVRGDGVLQIARLEPLRAAANDVAEIVGVGAVREHVRDFELQPALGVRIARHHHHHLAPPQIVGAWFAPPDALDFALPVAERDELLEELRVAMLDVIHAEHHIVAHLQREIQLVDFLARRRVGRLFRIERGDAVPEGRPVDFDEDDAEPVGHVFQQCRLAVTRGRDEQQQSHQVRAFGRAGRADLLGQVVPDERKINLVDELVADERREHPGLEFVEAQLGPLALDELRLELVELLEARHHLAFKARELFLKDQIVERIPALAQEGVTSLQAFEQLRRAGPGGGALQSVAAEKNGGDFLQEMSHLRAREQKAAPPVPDQLQLARGMAGERGARLLKRRLTPFDDEVVVERDGQFIRLAADHEGVAAAEFVKQIFARRAGDLGRVKFRVRDEPGHQRLERANVVVLRGIAGEQAVALGKTIQLGRPKRAGFRRAEPMPEDHRAGPRRGLITRQVQSHMRGEQSLENARAIQVMHALGVALFVTRAHELLHQGEALVVRHGRHGSDGWSVGAPLPSPLNGERLHGPQKVAMGAPERRVNVLPVWNRQSARRPTCQFQTGSTFRGRCRSAGALSDTLQQLPRKILGAIDLRVLGHHLLFPDIARGQKRLVQDRLEILRAREMEMLHALTVDDREIERLGVDVEPVLAELDDARPAREQFLPVLQLPHRLLLRALETPLQIVRLDRVAEFQQLPDDLAHLGDHQIGRHVGVDLVDGLEAAQPVLNGLEDALGGGEQRGGLAVALCNERDLALLERLVKRRALFRKLDGVFLEIREGSLQFLQLDADAVQIFLALRGRGAEVEIAGRRLAQQLHLRAELRRALGHHQALQAVLQRRLHLVQRRVNRGDAVDDPRGLGGVLDLKAVHDLDQHLKFAARRRHGLLDFLALGDLRHLLRGGEMFGGLLAIRIERRRLEQELDARLGQLIGLRNHRLLGFLHLGEIDVADLLERDQLPAQLTERGEIVDEIFQHAEARATQHLKAFFATFAHIVHALHGFALQTAHLVEFVHRLVRRLAHLAQGLVHLEPFRAAQPRVGVEDGAAAFDQIGVKRRVRILLSNEREHLVGFRQAAHHFLVAHLIKKSVALTGRLVPRLMEGRLPQLNHVMLLRLVIGAEEQQISVSKQREAVAGDALFDLLRDQPVGQKRVLAGLPVVEDEERVLAVGRIDDALDGHAAFPALEPF